MFVPHLSQIRIDRKEPSKDFNPTTAHIKVARSLSDLARRIVLKEGLKKKKDPVRQNKALQKVRKLVEFDERHKLTKVFMSAWNHWRLFYFDLAPIEPKTSGQLTVIESCIDYAKERSMDLNILIACIHRAYQKRKFRPNFDEIIKRGEDHYSLYEDVMSDIEREEYERKSMDN